MLVEAVSGSSSRQLYLNRAAEQCGAAEYAVAQQFQ
jgi:hypothetical protein